MANSSAIPLIAAALFFICFVGYHVLKKQKYTIGSIALGMGIVYLALMQTLALPLIDVRSGKDVAAILRDLPIKEDTTIATYTDYSTSAVFYSGHRIYRLVHEVDKTPATAKAYRKKKKNVMPQFAFKDIKSGDYVLSRDVERRPIDKQFAERLEYIGQAQRWTVYRVKD